MYLIFDTETSGLPIAGLSPNQPNYPRVLQLACILLDEKFQEKSSFYTLVKLPSHTTISPGAQAIHGIDKEMCDKYGMTSEHVCAIFQDFIDRSKVQIAHNLDFDYARIKDEFQLNFQYNDFTFTSPYCTMKATTDLCKLPGKYGKYKWPKLQEAYMHIFKKTFSKAHDALADCRACGEIFKWLYQNNLVIVN